MGLYADGAVMRSKKVPWSMDQLMSHHRAPDPWLSRWPALVSLPLPFLTCLPCVRSLWCVYAVERVGQARVLRSKNAFKGAGDESVDGAITIPLPKPGAEFGAFSCRFSYHHASTLIEQLWST